MEELHFFYVTPYFSNTPKGGPELRANATIQLLAEIGKVTVVVANPRSKFEKLENLQYANSTNHEVIVLRSQDSRDAEKKSLLSRMFFLYLLIFSPFKYRQIELIRKSLAKETETKVIFWISFAAELIPLSKILRKCYPENKFVGDTDSIYSDFIFRGIKENNFFWKPIFLVYFLLIRFRENSIPRLFDLVTVVSTIDKEKYLSRFKNLRIQLLKNYLPAENLKQSHQSKNANKLLIAGSFGTRNSSMYLGTKWFIDEVFDYVKQSYPDVKVCIVGRNAPLELTRPNIEVYADVPDIQEFFSDALINLVPLHFESGTRFKILEAAYHGKPSVSTTLGCEGLDFVNDLEIMIADSPIDFASAICSLLKNVELYEFIANNSNLKYNSEYSWSKAQIEIRRVVDLV